MCFLHRFCFQNQTKSMAFSCVVLLVMFCKSFCNNFQDQQLQNLEIHINLGMVQRKLFNKIIFEDFSLIVVDNCVLISQWHPSNQMYFVITPSRAVFQLRPFSQALLTRLFENRPTLLKAFSLQEIFLLYGLHYPKIHDFSWDKNAKVLGRVVYHYKQNLHNFNFVSIEK